MPCEQAGCHALAERVAHVAVGAVDALLRGPICSSDMRVMMRLDSSKPITAMPSGLNWATWSTSTLNDAAFGS